MNPYRPLSTELLASVLCAAMLAAFALFAGVGLWGAVQAMIK